MVSVTLVGCTLCTVTPGGTRTATSAGAELPVARPAPSTTAVTWAAVRTASVRTGPARTKPTVWGSVSATSAAGRFTAWTATNGNGRVPMSGAVETVTVDPARGQSDAPRGNT